MNIILLTHEKELLRKNGTGQLVKNKISDSTEIIRWKRKEPSSLIENDLNSKNTLLVYPGGDDENCTDFKHIENFILLDGTWQEANKIYNKSPYLKRFKKFSFSCSYKSTYNLRKNQKLSGLCTIESVIELYKLKENYGIVTLLQNAYDSFKLKFI